MVIWTLDLERHPHREELHPLLCALGSGYGFRMRELGVFEASIQVFG
jgi:hypothetical protein